MPFVCKITRVPGPAAAEPNAARGTLVLLPMLTIEEKYLDCNLVHVEVSRGDSAENY